MSLPIQFSDPRWLLVLATIPPVVALGVLSVRARPRDAARIRASIVIRSVIIALLALALAGFQLITSGGPLNVVFLVDQSASVSDAQSQAATNYVQQAIASMGPDDRAGVVMFGEQAVLARAISGDKVWKQFGKTPANTATNIADAIQAGLALFPEGGARRLLLISDGAETEGRAVEQAKLAAQTGVQLSVVTLSRGDESEVAVERVDSPNSVPAGQQFSVRALIKTSNRRTASVTLLDGSDPAGKQQAELRPGDNVVSFNVTPNREGFHVYTVRIESAGDRFSENNEASSFTMLRKPPTVLIVAGTPDDGTPLKQALSASNVRAVVVPPEQVPVREENLSQYDAVVLANASAGAIGIEAQQALQRFVRDLGHGLVMLGGDSSYGAGGYLRSPIEDVLPVTMDVRTSEQRASLALTFATDKSGSMGRCHCGGALKFNPSMRTEFGASKVEIAKQAISRAAALLNSSDKVGVVGFNEAAHWLVDLQPMSELGNGILEDDIKPMQAEGGTNLYSGLQAAIDGLQGTDAKLKHIILVSDGWSQQGDFSQLLAQMDAHNITLSTVGAGEGSSDLLKDLADKGGGRYYEAKDSNTIPDLFLKETVRLVGTYYVEEAFRPLLARPSPILKEIDTNSLPRLLGYNGSTLKANAEEVLKSPRGDPVLAQWQYGLGRSVAWTPDAKGRWATEWVKWSQFSRFAGQLVSWVLPTETSPGLETAFTPEVSTAGARAFSVRVESSTLGGAPRNFLNTTVALTSTVGVTKTEQIFQQSPGVYGGRLDGLKSGVYELRVEQRDPGSDRLVASQSTGLVVPYPSEFKYSAEASSAGRVLMGDVARLGGGRELEIGRPAVAFTHDIPTQPRPVALWPYLLVFAILLFPVDVAVRRLSFSRGDLRLAGGFARKRG